MLMGTRGEAVSVGIRVQEELALALPHCMRTGSLDTTPPPTLGGTCQGPWIVTAADGSAGPAL